MDWKISDWAQPVGFRFIPEQKRAILPAITLLVEYKAMINCLRLFILNPLIMLNRAYIACPATKNADLITSHPHLAS
jgi:hypothetical protein